MKEAVYAFIKICFWGILTFLMLSCTQSNQTEDLELIGHRGATGLVPENTIPGFKKALEFDVDGIEMDVVISGDEKVVVSHEPWFRHDICLKPEGDTLSRETQKDHLIYEMKYEMKYEQIAEYDCGSLQNSDYPEQKNQPLSKPLLREVITEVESHIAANDYDPIRYNIEIKSKPAWDNEIQPPAVETAKLVHEVLEDLEITDRVNIFAFDDRILNTFEKIDSSIPRVYLISKRKVDFSDNLSLLNSTPGVYAPNYSLVDSNLVEKVHAEGMRLIPWTVNEYEDMVRLVQMGVDGIMSDYPNYFDKLRSEVNLK